jgi:RNA polymerase sigma-70 factor, ECF subfamily
LELLMQRYQQSDTAAATLLAEQLSPRLYQYFLAQARQRDLAQDLLQECWLRIHKARHTYRPGEPLLPWIYAIANHTRVDQYRKARRIAQVELPVEDTGRLETAQAPSKTPAPELWELLKTLPAPQRETVLLLKVAGLSLQEVSRATGASVGAVKQRAHRAYTALRRLIGEKR